MFVADKDECYAIESNPERYYVENISDSSVKTNHYVHLPDRNRRFDDDPTFEAWTKNRYDRAKELLAHAESISDLQAILRDRENADKKTAICMTKDEKECCTYSAFIFDTVNQKVFYCQGNPLENDFKEYRF